MANTLSKNQIEYFKNSKVRDENGNLIVCYHGTQTPGFTEFNPQHSNTSQFGKYKFDKYNVNYFTSDIDVAKGYTELGVGDVEGERKNIYACYLNIENPFIVDNKTESEFKKWSNIKDNRVRDKHIKAFEQFAKKWLHTWVDDRDVNAINKDLHFFNHELRPCADVDQDEDAIIYDLWELGNNSFFGAEHEVMRYYYIEELFSEDNYEELRDCLVGNYEEDREDYYYTIDNIVRWVLLMNEEDGTDYDGIIVPDIADVGPKGNPFSPYCTDYITLKSGNQIKDIKNINPTPKYNIHEDAGEKQVKIFKQIYNKIIQAEKYYGTPQWEDLLFSPLHCFIGAVLYAYHYSCKEKQSCIFHLGGFDNTATIISHCWIEDSSGRIHDTRGMSDKSKYTSFIEIPIDINTDALSIIRLVKAVVERKALIEELKESETDSMNINEALTKLNNIDESLLQDLHRDNQRIKKVYGEKVYQALQEYCEQGNDLGNVLYTESGWKRFEKWLFNTKGVNIKEPNNYQILENADSKAYTYKQVRDELKLSTNNFTQKRGKFTYSFQSEVDLAVKILSGKYENVDYYTQDNKNAPEKLDYIVTFSNDKNKSIAESKNELKDRAKKHKKTDKKGARGWFVNPNAGDVEYNIGFLNKVLGNPSSAECATEAGGEISNGASMGESLQEALSNNVKIYEIEKDGLPEVGRQFIAYRTTHKEYEVYTREDKEYVHKQGWSDIDSHISKDGEFYSGKSGWIYPIDYDRYVYLDDLNLISPKTTQQDQLKQDNATKAIKTAFNKIFGSFGDKLAAAFTIKDKKGNVEIDFPFTLSDNSLDINYLVFENDSTINKRLIEPMKANNLNNADIEKIFNTIFSYKWENYYTRKHLAAYKQTVLDTFMDKNKKESLNEDTKGFSTAIKNLISKLTREYPDFTFMYNSKHKCVDMIKNDTKYAQIYPELDDELKDVTKSTLVRIYDKKDIQPSDIIYVKRNKKDSIKKYSSKNPQVKWVKKVGDKSLLNDICDELNATEIKEDLEKEENIIFKGFTIEHFPYKFIGGGKTIEHNSYIIRSPYCLQSPENEDKYYLPLYCENKDGEVINFNTLDQAKEYITKYISKKAGKLEIKYGDEVHFVLDKNLDESKKTEYEELYYPSLDIEVVTREGNPGGYYDSYMGQWYPDYSETEERTIDWTYYVRKEYVENLILEFMEDEGLDTDLSLREFAEIYDTYFDKYYDKILDAFKDEAIEDAEQNYREEDYIDWDSYGESFDKTLNENDEVEEQGSDDRYFDIEVALRKADLNYNYDYDSKFYFESKSDLEKACHLVRDLGYEKYDRHESDLCLHINPELKEDFDDLDDPYADDIQKFVYKAISALKLRSKADREYYAEMLEHDIRNLRGEEWFEIFDKPKHASILAELKELINYEEDIDENLKKNLNENQSLVSFYHSSDNPNLSYDSLDWNKSSEIGLHVGTKQAAMERNNKYFYEIIVDKSKMKIFKAPYDMNYWYTVELAKKIKDETLFKEISNILYSYIHDREEDAFLESSKAYRDYFFKKGINTISYQNEYEDVESESYILLDKSMIVDVKPKGQTNEQLDESIEKHPTLNPVLWDENKKLIPIVNKTLNKIVKAFVDYCAENDVKLNVKDSVIVGSNANYNYTKDSDIDLHLIVDFDDEEQYKLYDAYKRLFNDKYDLTIKDIPVEIYVEKDLNSINSNGIYSLQNEWLKEPVQKEIPDIDEEKLQIELNKYLNKYKNIKPEDAESLIDLLYELRQKALSKQGEYAIGNLVFKEFRNKGYLDELKDLRDKYTSSILSLA